MPEMNRPANFDDAGVGFGRELRRRERKEGGKFKGGDGAGRKGRGRRRFNMACWWLSFSLGWLGAWAGLLLPSSWLSPDPGWRVRAC